jgi:hypothetical protein
MNKQRAKYDVFPDGDVWYFEKARGGRSRKHATQEGALSAARASKHHDDVTGAVERLARITVGEPEVVLTILRVAFEELGRDRLADYVLTDPQKRKLLLAGFAVACGLEYKPTPAVRRYVTLFDDFVNLNWSAAWEAGEMASSELLDGAREILKGDPNRCIDGREAWKWVASAFGIVVSGVDQTLGDHLVGGNVNDVDLRKLSALIRRRPFRSHVHLLAHLVVTYYVSETFMKSRIQAEFVQCFVSRAEELRCDLNDTVSMCRRAVADAVQCAQAKLVLPGGMRSVSVAQMFLRFDAFESDIAWKKIRDTVVQRSRRSDSSSIVRSSGPKMIDNSRCPLSSHVSRETWPLGARELPAQGQKPSPRGYKP